MTHHTIKDPSALRILYINVIEGNAGWGAEWFVNRGFQSLGHTTHCIDFRKHRGSLHRQIKEVPDYDVFFLQRGDFFPMDIVENAGSPRLFWASELVGRCRDQDPLIKSGLFHHIFFHSQQCIDTVAGLNWIDRSKCSVLLNGFDETIHRPIPGIRKDIDVLFVGAITPRRERLINKLKARFSVTAASAFGHDLVRLFNRAKIVLNIHAEEYGDTETRVFEALGCGAFLLSEPLSSENPFSEDHLMEFDSFENLCDKIRHFLIRDEERHRIAQQGHLEAMARHTYTHRAAEIASVMKGCIETSQSNHRKVNFISPPKEDSMNHHSSYSPRSTAPARFSQDNHTMDNKKRKHLRIFAAYADVNWEEHNLRPALEHFGEVIRFSWNSNDQYCPDWHSSLKSRMNRNLLDSLKAAHRTKPIDVFFGYLSGRTIFPGIIQAIRLMGIPTLNISLDDKTKFIGALEATGHAGVIDIAGAFTLCWTSTEDAVEKYKAVGATAVYLPAGANPDVFKPHDFPRDLEVSFIGQKYGQRPVIIEELSKRGIEVRAFGKGWDSGEISQEEMIKLYSRSKITLGFAGVTDTTDVFCLKGRDFEVPMCGGFYLTRYHPELIHWFDVGKEIVCYHDTEDMIQKIRYYLAHPDEAEKIREAGRKRAHRDHSWVGRFEKVFTIMGILPRLSVDRPEDQKEPEFQYSEEWYDTVYHQGRFDLRMSFDEIEKTRYPAYQNRCYSVLDSAQDILLDKREKGESLKWLEVCCQLGMTAKWVKDKFPFISLYMFDFSTSVTQWVKANFPYEANVWKGKIEDIRTPESRFEGYFDVVSCIDVTEHLPEEVYISAIKEIHRVLKPGGLLFLMQGVCRENPEHINIREENQLVQDFIERGFQYQQNLPHRHHILRKVSVTKSDTIDDKQVYHHPNHIPGDRTIPILMKQGDAFYFSGNLDKATDAFREVLSIDPNHLEALNNLGVVAFQRQDLDLAVSLFGSVLSIDENHMDSIENLGKCFETREEYATALKWFQKALRIGGADTSILNHIGNCYTHLEEIDDAIRIYRVSMQMDGSQEIIRQLLEGLELAKQALVRGKTEHFPEIQEGV